MSGSPPTAVDLKDGGTRDRLIKGWLRDVPPYLVAVLSLIKG